MPTSLDDNELTAKCAAEASRFGVHKSIHPEDYLFEYARCDPSVADPVALYFSDGRDSALKLRNILFGELNLPDQPFSLLDFASGYGMVARHLPAVFPQARIATCDIHAEANRFNAANIGVRTIQSSPEPEGLAVGERFDVVFALSFFSHVPHQSFQRWLKQLYSLVTSGGHLVFTTHGRFSINAVLPDDSIYFKPRSEQKDLDSGLYGVSYATPTYVLKLIGALEQVPRRTKLALFREAFWWSHQDLYAVEKLRS